MEHCNSGSFYGWLNIYCRQLSKHNFTNCNSWWCIWNRRSNNYKSYYLGKIVLVHFNLWCSRWHSRRWSDLGNNPSIITSHLLNRRSGYLFDTKLWNSSSLKFEGYESWHWTTLKINSWGSSNQLPIIKWCKQKDLNYYFNWRTVKPKELKTYRRFHRYYLRRRTVHKNDWHWVQQDSYYDCTSDFRPI